MRPSSVGGAAYALHSVCLSVCPSVCPSVQFAEVVLLLFTLQPSYERTSKIEKKTSVFDYRPASTLRTCGIFCFVYICGPHTVGRSAAQACLFSFFSSEKKQLAERKCTIKLENCLKISVRRWGRGILSINQSV